MNINIDKNYTDKEFGDALRELIEKRDWSYKQLADRAGITKGFVGQIINKDVLPPKDIYIKKIAEAFRIEPEYFMEYRLRRCTEYLSKNPEHLKECYSKVMAKEKKKESPEKVS